MEARSIKTAFAFPAGELGDQSRTGIDFVHEQVLEEKKVVTIKLTRSYQYQPDSQVLKLHTFLRKCFYELFFQGQRQGSLPSPGEEL